MDHAELFYVQAALSLLSSVFLTSALVNWRLKGLGLVYYKLFVSGIILAMASSALC
jgi:hypothetical protein